MQTNLKKIITTLFLLFFAHIVCAKTDLIVQWDTQKAALPAPMWQLNDELQVTTYNLTRASKRPVKILKITVTEDSQAPSVILYLRKHIAVKTVEYDQVVSAQLFPGDARYNEQQHHDIINSEDIWNTRTDCSSVLVAVLDSGIDLDHPDLANNVWVNPNEIADNGIDDDNNGFIDDVHGWNFINDNNAPEDDGGHGSHVAGLFGAIGDNQGVGVAGVCWQAKIMPVKVLADTGGNLSDLASGVDYATAMGARIMILSLDFDNFDTALFNQMQTAEAENDTLFFIAAGNSALDIDKNAVYPAAYSPLLNNTIAVANVTDELARSTNSNYGANIVDIAAPGTNLLSTSLDADYKIQSGTSMAAPLVAGAAAIALSEDNTLSSLTLRSALIHSVTSNSDLQWLSKSGGVLNLETLLDNTQQIQPTLFSINPDQPTELRGLGLTDTTSVTFTQFTSSNSTQTEIPHVVSSDKLITLGSAAQRPGFYTAISASGNSNVLASWAQETPNAPQNLSVLINGSGYALTWTESALADVYVIDRNINGTWSELATTTASPYFDTSIPTNDTIQYRMRARYSYVNPTTKASSNITSDYSTTVAPGTQVFSGAWLTEELATIPKSYDFINLRLKTSVDSTLKYDVSGGSLPNNLYLSDDVGHITGDPNEIGTFTVSVTYTGSGVSGSRQFKLNITESNDLILDEPNADIAMNFRINQGQVTSLQNKSNSDLNIKSIRLTAYNFDEPMSDVIITAQPDQFVGGTIQNIQARIGTGGWATLDNSSPNLAINNGLSWKVQDNLTYDLNEKDNLIEVEFAITWQELPTEPTVDDTDNATEESSGGTANYWLFILLALGLRNKAAKRYLNIR
ncbi:S8 family serine peptidase [Algibacillus agarilyticus]|uniref:S8 family serine peptidase n=1 Tax=Algibacillus agarilyticus TaxID=2234133 RepID=UPI000DD0701C|nr:S8 family serine peptidase [Algibacillus agarilyticus]